MRPVPFHLLPLLVVSAAALCWGRPGNHAAAAEPLRVVPQLGWAAEGRAAPDGVLYAACEHRAHNVHLVDAKRSALVWAIPLWEPHGVFFSPDGRWLAACGTDRGLLLDLRSGELRYLPVLRGLLIAFTPDSKHVLVVRCTADRLARREEPDDDGLFVCDLAGEQKVRYPLSMSIPQRIRFLFDGKIVRIEGLAGNPMMHVPRMARAVQMVELETGKIEHDHGPIERGWRKPPKDPALVKLPPLPRDKTVRQQPAELYWNEIGGACVLFGTGAPEGGVAKAWDIRAGRFLRTLGRGNQVSHVGGFLRPGTVLANAWKDGKCHLSLIDVRTGEVTPTPLAQSVSFPASDGKHFTVHVGWATGEPEQWLELHAVPPGKPLYREKINRGEVGPHGWSRQGRYLIRSRRRGAEARVTLVRAADGKVEHIKLGDFLAKHTVRKGWELQIWCLELDEDAGRLAIGVGEPKLGMVLVVRLADNKIETVLEGFPVWPGALRFVADDRLLIGLRNGVAQLRDLETRRPLWTTETQEELLQFDHVPGGPYVVCGHQFRSASVLRLADGKLLRKTRRLLDSDSSVPLPWINPKLIGRGDLALEMVPGTLQIRLVETATGKTHLTYCALPEDQWIVYTPQGDWDGSAAVHDWVKFCRGLKPVEEAEADRRRNRERLDTVLKQTTGFARSRGRTTPGSRRSPAGRSSSAK